MDPIVYSMHFRGQASTRADDPKSFKLTASAASCTFTTMIGAAGVEGRFSVVDDGDMAFSESEFHITGPDSFSGKESISFGDLHVLELVPSQPGQFSRSGPGGIMTGSITWRVEGGEGQFTGASGYVTSMFTLDHDGQINEYQVGMIHTAATQSAGA